MTVMGTAWRFATAPVMVAWCLAPIQAQDAASPETWSLHGQVTFVEQYHPAFRSPYRGANSLDPGSRGDETITATLYAGARVWDGAEVYADPEVDQGFGLSNTTGLAGFSNGEGSKVGSATPYFRLQRLFLRQTIDLGGEAEDIAPDANQLGGRRTADNVVFTIGKFAATDIFDDNAYAHDPARTFLNWSVIDGAAYDYAADAWGYTYGMTAEWTQSWWTLRGGLFDLSRIPNGTALVRGFCQFELVAEAEERYELRGQPGNLKLLGYVNRGHMGSYNDALKLAMQTHTVPDISLVRKYASRAGAEVNLEQQITSDIGLFARVSFNDGSKEAYEYTEINRSFSAGLSLKGTNWGRRNDTVGIAVVADVLSTPGRAYFAAGGIGILIGDGRLNYGTEHILEAYYSAQLVGGLVASTDYQLAVNPAYNRDRGPVSILGVRLHAEF